MFPTHTQNSSRQPKKLAHVSTRRSRAIVFHEPPLAHLQLYSLHGLELIPLDEQAEKTYTKMCVTLARSLQAYTGGIGWEEGLKATRKMKPDDGGMLANFRELDINIAKFCKKGKIEAADRDIRLLRTGVRGRTHLFLQQVLTTSVGHHHAFCRKTPQMDTFPDRLYTFDRQSLTYHVQKHWWKLFKEANQRRTTNSSKYGGACHPASLLVLLTLVQYIQKLRQQKVPRSPVELECLLETAVKDYPALLSCQGRLPLGFYTLAGELIECVLYAFVGKEMPAECKDGGIPIAEGRKKLFVD